MVVNVIKGFSNIIVKKPMHILPIKWHLLERCVGAFPGFEFVGELAKDCSAGRKDPVSNAFVPCPSQFSNWVEGQRKGSASWE